MARVERKALNQNHPPFIVDSTYVRAVCTTGGRRPDCRIISQIRGRSFPIAPAASDTYSPFPGKRQILSKEIGLAEAKGGALFLSLASGLGIPIIVSSINVHRSFSRGKRDGTDAAFSTSRKTQASFVTVTAQQAVNPPGWTIIHPRQIGQPINPAGIKAPLT